MNTIGLECLECRSLDAIALGNEWAALAKHADLALYEAKAAGRGCYRFFEIEMERSMQAQRTLALELHEAIGRHEFDEHPLGAPHAAGTEAVPGDDCGVERLAEPAVGEV